MDEELNEGSGVGAGEGSGNVAVDAEYMVEDKDEYCVESFEDISRIDFLSLSKDDVYRFHFADVSLAYDFYNRYARMWGFGARKSKSLNNKKGERSQQVSVYFREGFRDKKFYEMENRVREPKPTDRKSTENLDCM